MFFGFFYFAHYKIKEKAIVREEKVKTLITSLLGFTLSRALKGGSEVVRDGGKAIKVFRPKPLVRLIYLMFYGRTRSHYETMDGMRWAFLLRKIANHVTMFDSVIRRPTFAHPFEVTEYKGKPALVMEWIDGRPVGKEEAKGFQLLLERTLLRSGLPTWPINIQNPGAYQDMRHTAGGIIALDYESALPPLFVNKEERALMRRSGKWLPIDWVDIERLEQTLERARTMEYSGFDAFDRHVKAFKSFHRRRFR